MQLWDYEYYKTKKGDPASNGLGHKETPRSLSVVALRNPLRADRTSCSSQWPLQDRCVQADCSRTCVTHFLSHVRTWPGSGAETQASQSGRACLGWVGGLVPEPSLRR